MAGPRKQPAKRSKSVETLTHDEAKRKNIPTAEHRSVVEKEALDPIRVAYERRNRDLDPQLVWRGKDEQDWSDLVVQAPPLYIQEKVHPKVLIDDLLRQTKKQNAEESGHQPDLFADFNGIPEGVDKTEFYQHDQNWSNRMILGDSLQVMASLAEREGLRGKVQCIYIDPPYGIKFNSNFQWSTTDNKPKDGNAGHITREPEQVKAFRDTWRDGIHSYLTYLRDRLTVARDLLNDSGSIFVQIGDENLSRLRELLNEIFGEDNVLIIIPFQKKAYQDAVSLAPVNDYLVWAAKSKASLKFRPLYMPTPFEGDVGKYTRIESPNLDLENSNDKEHETLQSLLVQGWRLVREDYPVVSQDPPRAPQPFEYQGVSYDPPPGRHWSQKWPDGMQRLAIAGRLRGTGSRLYAREYWTDSAIVPRNNLWVKLKGPSSPNYVVETAPEVIKRCILMATDPGDLVLDPTCGSGTTAFVAEQWGRRWITIDTSRVALALARARIMGARYPYYLLADSREGQQKEAEVTRTAPSSQPVHENIRHGFVYERVPHITLKSIANNAEIDVIWEQWQVKLKPLRESLNAALKKSWQEWEIPREADAKWPDAAKKLHADWWQARIARQQEIDKSIAAKAEYEYLYDKPYSDNKKVRVAGPFTVESLSPHRVLAVDENDELIDTVAESKGCYGEKRDFATIILENLRMAGVQQAHKEDKIAFTSLVPWPGNLVCAEGRYIDGDGKEKRAAVFIGPEFGTVTRPDLVEAAKEAGDANFDVLIACAFNYEAMATEFNKLGRIPVLKARMNADLHMADDLKNTGKGNLFVIFGEPDITVVSEEWIVDSTGRRVAPYEIFKLVSGVSSLAEINGLGGENLQKYVRISNHREVWNHLADAAGSKLNSGEHSGRAGKAYNGGVSSVAWHCEGLAGGVGNLCDALRKAGLSKSADFRGLVERLRGDKQNAPRTDEVAVSPPLTTIHYSQIAVHGVDVFHPQTGEVRSDDADGIACWFIDTDYNEESFFVRHAYFLGANDPYSALKTTLKAEINAEAWETLHSNISRPFDKPASGRIAVKVINHLGDEVMKVFKLA